MSTQSGQYCKRKETGLNFRIFFSLLWQLETESTKKICSGSNQPSSVTALSILKTVRLRLWPKKNCSALASPNSSAPALVPAKTARLRRWYQQKNSSALALAGQNSSAPALVSAKTALLWLWPDKTARFRLWYQPKHAALLRLCTVWKVLTDSLHVTDDAIASSMWRKVK